MVPNFVPVKSKLLVDVYFDINNHFTVANCTQRGLCVCVCVYICTNMSECIPSTVASRTNVDEVRQKREHC